jgi:alpha-glucosidase
VSGGSWWREGVLYHVYVRSFADSDGDGVGDLRGVSSRLDHLAWLGVDGVWLSPTTPSPNADWGYDVADYRDVDPALGTLAELDELVAAARSRGIRVLLDLVPNHTSDRHPWFVESRSSRDSAKRGWYVWVDRPNNWRSVFGGSAWERDDATGQWYLHNFLPEQPDLDWWNEDVRAEFDAILRFWLDRGIAGFRIDVAHAFVHDRLLRDNPPAPPDAKAAEQRIGQLLVYSLNRPEAHEVLRRWRRVTDAYDERLLLGETFVLELDRMAAFYGDGGDELHLAQNIPFVLAEPESLPEIVAETLELLPPGAWPVWFGSNHDVGRLATRWACGDERVARCALLALLALPGTPILYYGDEVGLEDVDVPPERRLDPAEPPRDGCRTPMPWTRAGGEWREPWLPLGPTERNVEEQRRDPRSTLGLCRELIRLRRAFVREPYERLAAPAGTWRWRRGAFTISVDFRAGTGAVERDGEGLLLELP